MRVGIEISTSTLGFDPVRGRRTFYITLQLGRRTLWLMRWDTDRTRDYRHRFAFSRDGLMSWTCGVHR